MSISNQVTPLTLAVWNITTRLTGTSNPDARDGWAIVWCDFLRVGEPAHTSYPVSVVCKSDEKGEHFALIAPDGCRVFVITVGKSVGNPSRFWNAAIDWLVERARCL